MARLRNIKSGAVIHVGDETAKRMGGEWEPVQAPTPATKRTAKKSAPKPSED